ncbi:DUF6491 family protein [Sphingomonas bacterium]|uniref:DUF6491 family protein n=1 Tax=Sphingomonas bacterium TaxID=1895847 RepID=UPI001574EEE0|nr:DUF6491 family protein [Sphingomonas bacterium]
MKKMLFALALSLVAGGSAQARSRPLGAETTIPFASNGGLRDWQRGGAQSDALWVRDRTEQWYLVRLSGRCRFDFPLDTLIYTTDPSGIFDRFSTVRVGSEPYQVCGVRSIVASAPPPGHEGQGRTKPAG